MPHGESCNYSNSEQKESHMARVAGRLGNIYVDTSSAGNGSAGPVHFLNKWALDGTADQFDVTAFGDGSKVYVQGLPDAKGTASGFYDATATTGSQALFAMAQSGVARQCYLYPTTPSTAGPYFFGTAFFSASYDIDVSQSANISMTFSAATPFQVVG